MLTRQGESWSAAGVTFDLFYTDSVYYAYSLFYTVSQRHSLVRCYRKKTRRLLDSSFHFHGLRLQVLRYRSLWTQSLLSTKPKLDALVTSSPVYPILISCNGPCINHMCLNALVDCLIVGGTKRSRGEVPRGVRAAREREREIAEVQELKVGEPLPSYFSVQLKNTLRSILNWRRSSMMKSGMTTGDIDKNLPFEHSLSSHLGASYRPVWFEIRASNQFLVHFLQLGLCHVLTFLFMNLISVTRAFQFASGQHLW